MFLFAQSTVVLNLFCIKTLFPSTSSKAMALVMFQIIFEAYRKCVVFPTYLSLVSCMHIFTIQIVLWRTNFYKNTIYIPTSFRYYICFIVCNCVLKIHNNRYLHVDQYDSLCRFHFCLYLGKTGLERESHESKNKTIISCNFLTSPEYIPSDDITFN